MVQEANPMCGIMAENSTCVLLSGCMEPQKLTGENPKRMIVKKKKRRKRRRGKDSSDYIQELNRKFIKGELTIDQRNLRVRLERIFHAE